MELSVSKFQVDDFTYAEINCDDVITHQIKERYEKQDLNGRNNENIDIELNIKNAK